MSRKVLTALVVVLFFTAGILILINHYFFSMSALPAGELIGSSTSPDNEYTINIYLVNTHATVSYAIRGELKNNKTGRMNNIYWDYRVDKAIVKWESSRMVRINGHLIKIPNGIYDFRNNE